MSAPEPKRSLEDALEGLQFRLEPGRFCLVGFPEAPGSEDLEALRDPPGQLIRELGETTLLVREERLSELIDRHPNAQVEGGLIWIRFQAAMGWEVVGFLARVTSQLAAAGVPLGAVCGYSRDHLFVAEKYIERAREVLLRFAVEESGA